MFKACVFYFLYFTEGKHFKNYVKFSFPLNSSVCSWDIQNFVVFFLFLSTFSRFKWSKKNFSKHVLQLIKRLVTSSRSFFVFLNLLHKNRLAANKNIKLTCPWSPLKYLIFKSLLNALAFSAIYHWTNFYCKFSACLFHKNVSYEIPYQITKFQYFGRVT